jgi:hypothetical protein
MTYKDFKFLVPLIVMFISCQDAELQKISLPDRFAKDIDLTQYKPLDAKVDSSHNPHHDQSTSIQEDQSIIHDPDQSKIVSPDQSNFGNTDQSAIINIDQSTFNDLDQSNFGNTDQSNTAGIQAGGSPSGGSHPPVDLCLNLNCDDGNVCNGIETCDPMQGCQPGQALACDDGNGCNGIETCDPIQGCQPASFPACAYAADSCADTGGVGRAQADRVTSVPVGNLGLRELGFDDLRYQLIDELASASTNRYVSISNLNLNRQTQRINSWPRTPCFNMGFKWNDGDNAVRYWYPQGITGTADAYDDNQFNGQKYLIVSWYNNTDAQASTDPNRGVRISVVRSTDLDDAPYRHILLVVPSRDDQGRPTYGISGVHAGGIIWYQNYLYVVDTNNGFRVYDLNKIIYVPALDGIGRLADGRYGSHGYQYVLPEVGRYTKCAEACCAKYSYGGLDRSTTPHTIVTGGYSDRNINTIAYRWQLGADGKLITTQKTARPIEAVYMGVSNIQGMLSYEGKFFAASSFRSGDASSSPDHLYYGNINQRVTDRDVPYGIEDLHYSPSSDRIWTLTEHPGNRAVVGMIKADLLNGCP